jgi:hypothetical protein
VKRRVLFGLVATSTYSLLTIAFIGLRVAGLLDWPWVWVFSPIWLPLSVIGAVLGTQLLLNQID